MSRDHNNREFSVERLDEVEQLQSVQSPALHPDVLNEYGRPAFSDRSKSLVGVRGCPNRIPLIFQNTGDQVPNILLIVDDKNVCSHDQTLLMLTSGHGRQTGRTVVLMESEAKLWRPVFRRRP